MAVSVVTDAHIIAFVNCQPVQMFPGARFPPQFAGFPPPGPPFFHPDARYQMDLFCTFLYNYMYIQR